MQNALSDIGKFTRISSLLTATAANTTQGTIAIDRVSRTLFHFSPVTEMNDCYCVCEYSYLHE